MNKSDSIEKAKLKLFDKIKGIIYGAALGDAVGLSTEFMTEPKAKILYGFGPIKFGKADGYEFWRDRHRSRWFPNDFTDDTDQLLLILQCLLSTDGYLVPAHLAFRLKEWTKEGFPELNKIACGIGYTVGSVLSHPEFVSNPHKASYDIWDKSGRNLAANGAVMRTSVLGVPYFWDESKVLENSMVAAKVTHADPRSVASAVIVSVIISKMLRLTLVGEKPTAESVITDMTEQHLKEILKVFEAGSPHSEYNLFSKENFQQYDVTLSPKCKTKPAQSSKKTFLNSLFPFLRKDSPEDELESLRASLPTYKEPDNFRLQNPAKIPKTLPNGMDEYGSDNEMMSICKNVVETYEFLLKSSHLCQIQPNPDESEKSSISKEATWIEEIHSHCFPFKLSDLKLDEPKKIGYTFKCLGSAVYCLTRAQPPNQTAGTFYKNMITELTLQAGDADTNCAVAGALLGCRLGAKGLPQDWLDGLRHFKFLQDISNQLCDLVWSKYNE